LHDCTHMQSKFNDTKATTARRSNHRDERATEVRSMADETNEPDVRAIPEQAASLYDALANRPDLRTQRHPLAPLATTFFSVAALLPWQVAGTCPPQAGQR
jgi:hypothetical protein